MREVAVALLRRGGRWFLQRRDPHNAMLPSCWEFPGGKVEVGESPAVALRRELREEVGLDCRQIWVGPVFEGQVRLHTFFVEAEGSPRTQLAWGWFGAADMLRLPIPPLNVALVEYLREFDGEPRRGFGPLL